MFVNYLKSQIFLIQRWLTLLKLLLVLLLVEHICEQSHHFFFMKRDFIQKQSEYKSNLVGQDFVTQALDANHVCVSLIGEILEARNFDGSNLFIQWQFKLPQYWEVDNSELVEYDPEEYEQVQLDEWNRLKSITQQSECKTQKSDDGQMSSVAHFCFPFDLQLQTPERSIYSRWPVLLLQINSIDSWDRNRVEGYGFLEMPHTPGFHQLTVKTFKPNDDLYTRIYEFFLGGAIKIKEFECLSDAYFVDQYDTTRLLNRFPLDTESSGEVVVRINVSIQREDYKLEQRKRHEIMQKKELFNKIREKRQPQQQSTSKGLPTALMKTDMGFVNRFSNTQLPFQ